MKKEFKKFVNLLISTLKNKEIINLVFKAISKNVLE
jgi:hypothetical protein